MRNARFFYGKKDPRRLPGKIMGGWKGNSFRKSSAVAAVVISVVVSVSIAISIPVTVSVTISVSVTVSVFVAIPISVAVSIAISVSMTVSVAVSVSVAISVSTTVSVAVSVSEITVRGTEDGTETAAGARFSRRREQIHREADIFESFARIAVSCRRSAAFGHASAQRIYYHVDGAEQLYNGEQTDGYIDSDRCAQGGIAVVPTGIAGITATIAATGVAGRMTQFCCQSDGFAFGDDERSAVGSAVAELVCYSGHIGFGGTKQSHPQVVGVCGIYAPNKTSISPSEFQGIVKYIFQFQIPAASLQGIGFLPQDLDTIQFQIADGDISGIAGGNDDIPFAQHIVAAGVVASCRPGGPQNVAA